MLGSQYPGATRISKLFPFPQAAPELLFAQVTKHGGQYPVAFATKSCSTPIWLIFQRPAEFPQSAQFTD